MGQKRGVPPSAGHAGDVDNLPAKPLFSSGVCVAICRAAAWVQKKVPLAFTSKLDPNSLSVRSRKRFMVLTPALFTQISRRAHSWTIRWTASLGSWLPGHIQFQGHGFPAGWRNFLATTCLAQSILISETATRAPAWPKRARWLSQYPNLRP